MKSFILNPFRQAARKTGIGDGPQSSMKQENLSPPSTNFPAGNSEAESDHGTAHALAVGESPIPSQPCSINVLLFGETDVSRSSIVNFIAQKEVAQVSSDANGSTMQSTRYDISFDNMDFAIFDTTGLGEPQMGVSGYLTAIERAYELIMKLSAAGGIHLLLFCARRGKITAVTQSNYRLLCECLSSAKVPMAFVFTGPGGEMEFEDWRFRNKTHVEHYGIGQVCITPVRADAPGENLKYTESQKKIRELLKICALQTEAFSPEPHSWFAKLGKKMRNFIEKQSDPEKEDIIRVLTHRCKLDPEIASRIASMMEEGDTETEDESGQDEDVRQGSFGKLERLGDAAVDAKRYDEAISHYSVALSLVSFPQAILIKRSKALLANKSWQEALDDANQVITFNPSSPWGYEVKHAALHNVGDHDNAINAFETMLSKMTNSPDPNVQRQADKYINPSSTRATIRRIIQQITRHSPRVLINTTTGRLHDRPESAYAFESQPIFKELVSSTTRRFDYVRIKREVRQYFRYVMLSHIWEENEPLFQSVIHVAVYDLEKSPTHDKLQTFCKIVRDAGFSWAWSDTCCINKSDHFILQEALAAMFRWYQRAAMTIIFLRDVRSSSQRGALVRSIWNSRAWTLQDFVASKVIRFYTADWTLYLDLQLPNHKESPEIFSEMEEATGVPARQLMALRPGLTSIREKLCLASTRRATAVEDAAYSLLGIFSITSIPIIYGEGERSLGRLLAHVLTGSGDVGILAWTGESGSFNSCLPAYITVFYGPATSHVPQPISDAEMERITAIMQPSWADALPMRRLPGRRNFFDFNVALKLYDRLNELPVPCFVERRMKLPCIVFRLPPHPPTPTPHVYHADTVTFGTVEIKTRQYLPWMQFLYIVHPWLDALLGREAMHGGRFTEDDASPSPSADDDESFDNRIEDVATDDSSLPEPVRSHPGYIPVAQIDRETQARRLVARLRQPFGALLLAQVSTGGRVVDYRRVAADSLITVQLQDNVSLTEILDNVRILDVL